MSSIALILETCLKRTNTLIRFLMVGVVNTITGLSIMLLLLNVAGQSYWVSTFLGNSCGAFISYFLNRRFTFQSKVNIKKGVFRFITVTLFCYLFSFTISNFVGGAIEGIYFFNSLLIKGNLAIFIGTGVYTLTNYFGQKFYVFKR